MDIASTQVNLDALTIQHRNSSVEKQLADNYLYSIDVVGDGNCFFRALSLSLHGSQSLHAQLRKAIALHLRDNTTAVFGPSLSDDLCAVRDCVNSLLTNGSWAGEEAIVTAADYLQREIQIYTSFGTTSPLIYSPASCAPCHPPIALAFFEPGHYRLVADQSTYRSERIAGNLFPQGNAHPPAKT
jgi:hypothetical protein